MRKTSPWANSFLIRQVSMTPLHDFTGRVRVLSNDNLIAMAMALDEWLGEIDPDGLLEVLSSEWADHDEVGALAFYVRNRLSIAKREITRREEAI